MQAHYTKKLFFFFIFCGNRSVSLQVEDEQATTVVSEPKTPYQYFSQYYGDQFWEECAFRTNLYSVQERSGRSVKTDTEELKVFYWDTHPNGNSKATPGADLLVAHAQHGYHFKGDAT